MDTKTKAGQAEYADIRRVISNCQSLPERAEVRRDHFETLLDKFIELPSQFFESLYLFANEKTLAVTRERFKPLPHQEKIINQVVQGLRQHDRGKLVAACGIGKTLAALWIAEEINAQRVLVLAPSIALVGQTLREWVMQCSSPFAYLGVCSDTTIDENVSDLDVSVSELDISVTTDINNIKLWLENTSNQKQYIFCTYHSSNVIQDVMRLIPDYRFDFIVFDEAHRTVGVADQMFSTALVDERIPAQKRLFMTATEKLVNPRISSLAEQSGQVVFSMDDEDIYGQTFCEYNFGQAISDGVIADYEIVLAEVTDSEEEDRIQRNRLLQLELNGEQFEISSSELFKASFLLKAISEGLIKKTITFHSFRRNAIAFHRALVFLSSRHEAIQRLSPFFSFVLGNQNASDRVVRIQQFADANVGVLGNVQVLSEGVDIPIIDSIYFVDPKTSLIDLVQAIGRALRKPYGTIDNKIAKIIVPVVVPEDVIDLNDISWDETLQTFYNVIQAMRNHDSRLAEEINEINQYAVTGGARGRRVGGSGRSLITIQAPNLGLRESFSIEEFLEKINLRIATATANPDGTNTGFSHLGVGERKSEYKTHFSPMGDYNPVPYQDSLVIPTLALFDTDERVLTSEQIEINNNNLSHCKYLGVVEEHQGKQYRLTRIGKLLRNGQVSFETIFKNQLLLFESDGLFPYRMILEILLKLNHLTHYEFLYGPYIIRPKENGEFDVNGVIQRVKFLRERFPNIELTSIANRDAVREQLNEVSPVSISDKDLWGDRTTVNNKFRYVKNALSLFEFIDAGDGGFRTPVMLKNGKENAVLRVLDMSHPSKAPHTNFYGQWIWLQE